LTKKKKLERHRDLLTARIFLEEENILSEQEMTYHKSDTILDMAKFLILKNEIQKAFNLCLKFKFTLEDTLGYYIKRFFDAEPNENEPEEDKKFYDNLEKLLKLLDSKDRSTYLKIISHDLLFYSFQKYNEPNELPYFLTNFYMQENPNDLIRIYVDFNLIEKAVFWMNKAIRSNLSVLNDKEKQQIDEMTWKKSIKYIDPEILAELIKILQTQGMDDQDIDKPKLFNSLLNSIDALYTHMDEVSMAH